MHEPLGGEGGGVVPGVVVDAALAGGVVEGGIVTVATRSAADDHARGLLKGAAKGKPVSFRAGRLAPTFRRALALVAVDER